MTILDEILARKREEVATARASVPDAELVARAAEAAQPRGLRDALDRGEAPCVIAEIKQRSPSKGLIRPDFDAEACARAYTEGGACALSVLTDGPFFGGSLRDLAAVRKVSPLPILRKDFVVDGYQIVEARAHAADAVLLIVAALDAHQLADLHAHARGLDLDVLVEVHDEAELEVAVAVGAALIGVNNRDLRTFTTDLATTERLAPGVPAGALLVAESGIEGAADIARLRGAGARAFLVGESLMRQPDPAEALRRLRGEPVEEGAEAP